MPHPVRHQGRREASRGGGPPLRVLLAALVVVGLALVTVDVRGGGRPTDALRAGAAAVLGPPVRVAATAVGAVGDAARGLTGADAREADRLAAEVARLRGDLAARDDLAAQEAQLAALYGMTGRGQYRTVAARVVALGEGLAGSAWTAVIDLGSSSGIAADMTVVNGDGLVGRVTRVGPVTSTVLLAADPGSAVGARLEGSAAGPAPAAGARAGEAGLVEGGGAGEMLLRLFDPQAAVVPGQRVVTFGSTFVPGVPVGEVVEVRATPGALERQALVRPAVDPTALDVVGVVLEAAAGDPRDAVLPPRPAPEPVPPAPAPDSGAPAPDRDADTVGLVREAG